MTVCGNSPVVLIDTDSEPIGAYGQKCCATIRVNAKDMPRIGFRVKPNNALISHTIFCGWMELLLGMKNLWMSGFFTKCKKHGIWDQEKKCLPDAKNIFFDGPLMDA
jgi:hypothetical protein